MDFEFRFKLFEWSEREIPELLTLAGVLSVPPIALRFMELSPLVPYDTKFSRDIDVASVPNKSREDVDELLIDL